ncbi:MAG: bifunctional hydroxymethylpyrimidine kinase/phosphomethylpyrimidine kinase [Lepagella sp.]
MMPVVLCISGSDNTAGAGMQADIKTCCALSCYPVSVVTAVTAQNPDGVKGVLYVGDDMLDAQFEATLSYFKPDAVKIGMIPVASAVDVIARHIELYDLHNIVIDPVMSATSGGSLIGDTSQTVRRMCEELFGKATLVTPNIPELRQLARMSVTDAALSKIEPGLSDIGVNDEEVTRRLMNRYDINAILLKGGHGEGKECIDKLYRHDRYKQRDEAEEFKAARIESNHTHGTGCTLSSAIAAGLAQGMDLSRAICQAKAFVHDSIIRATNHPLLPDQSPLLQFPT